jgi:membrane-bound lytic murein transglycosylase D
MALAQELMQANKSQLPGGEIFVATVAPPPSTSSSSSSGKKKKRPHEYRVRAGDSLAAIAREHSCDLRELAKANRLRSPGYMIRPGQRIHLKGCDEG